MFYMIFDNVLYDVLYDICSRLKNVTNRYAAINGKKINTLEYKINYGF